MQVCWLPYVAHIRAQDESDKEDQQSAGLAFLRPVALTVEAELTLHLLEVLLLLVPQSIQFPSLQRSHVHSKRRNGIEA